VRSVIISHYMNSFDCCACNLSFDYWYTCQETMPCSVSAASYQWKLKLTLFVSISWWLVYFCDVFQCPCYSYELWFCDFYAWFISSCVALLFFAHLFNLGVKILQMFTKKNVKFDSILNKGESTLLISKTVTLKTINGWKYQYGYPNRK